MPYHLAASAPAKALSTSHLMPAMPFASPYRTAESRHGPDIPLRRHPIPRDHGPSTHSSPYLAVARGSGWDSWVHTTKGGG